MQDTCQTYASYMQYLCIYAKYIEHICKIYASIYARYMQDIFTNIYARYMQDIYNIHARYIQSNRRWLAGRPGPGTRLRAGPGRPASRRQLSADPALAGYTACEKPLLSVNLLPYVLSVPFLISSVLPKTVSREGPGGSSTIDYLRPLPPPKALPTSSPKKK